MFIAAILFNVLNAFSRFHTINPVFNPVSHAKQFVLQRGISSKTEFHKFL